jgi:HAD superfamily hydrolase (TIGR01549 family)
MNPTIDSIHSDRPLWFFFDVGFTLLDESAAWSDQFHRLASALAKAGTFCSVEQLHAHFQHACVTFAARQWRAVVSRVVDEADINHYLKLSDGWRHDLETPMPRARQTLADLSKRYKLGVIANQSAGTRERLERHGMLEYLSVVIGSAEAGVGKPDPHIFRMALQAARCDATRAVMVGDRLDNDIRPAKALGMTTVHFRQGGSGAQRPRHAAETPDYSIESLDELLRIFAR